MLLFKRQNKPQHFAGIYLLFLNRPGLIRPQCLSSSKVRCRNSGRLGLSEYIKDLLAGGHGISSDACVLSLAILALLSKRRSGLQL